MKILRIVSAGYEQGGVENGIVLTNKILEQKGHQIKVISSNIRPDKNRFSDYEFSKIPESGFKKIIYCAFNISAYKTTKRVLQDFQPDVVLLHTMVQPTAAVLFLLKNYRTILFVHGPEIYTSTLLPWFLQSQDYSDGSYDLSKLTITGRLHYWYFRYFCGVFYKISWKNINTVVALSSYTESMLRKEGYLPIYIPNGASLLPPERPRTNNQVIFSAGRLEKFKGFDVLITAVGILQKKFPNISLRIAGEGSFHEDLRRLITAHSLSSSVTLLGNLDADRMKQEYANCAIFVLPSIWPETFGKVGIEAMSIGRPVIATKVGGVQDWLENEQNGLLVDPGDSKEMAKALDKLLSDQKLLLDMSENAEKTAQKFSMTEFANNIDTLISNQ